MSTTLAKKFWSSYSEFNYLEKNSSVSSVALFVGQNGMGFIVGAPKVFGRSS